MIGRQVSHFYMIRTLGSGGMGVVYEAQDTRLPRSVAIKFLKPSIAKDADAVRRFKREAKLASSLNHQNICSILEVDERDGLSFIAMELLQGRSLKSRLSGGALEIREILDVASQVAGALAAAHERGIIHRDITPGNIFLTDDRLVKLLDFGLAKQIGRVGEEDVTTDSMTQPGSLAGTIHYMSPEQLAEGAILDHRSDLFSLGAVLYQMVTGARPFDIAPRTALIRAIRDEAHVPPRQLAPHTPAALEQIIDKLLAKQPDERYQSAADLRADLDSLNGTLHTGNATPEPNTSNVGSVAVLPFQPVGAPDEATAALAVGLVEDLSGHLSRFTALRVAPRTSTRAAVGRSVREIGQRLGVDMVLEGTVQRVDDAVRASATLIDAAQEQSLAPTIKIDRPFGHLLTLQEDLARAITDGFAPWFSRAAGRPYTREPEAYHAFKRGQHHWKACFAGGWRAAIDHFQYAIERDPRFALGHVALAGAYNFLGFYCLMKPNLAFRVAEAAAARALEIDSTLARAHLEMALAKFGGDWDWEWSEQAFRRAIALDSRDPLIHVHYSWLLILLGREEAALAEAQKGHELAPSARFVATARAQTLYVAGRYDEAIAICTDCLRLDPDYVFALHQRGLSYLASSVRDGAIADLERAATLSNRAPFYLGLLGRCYGQYGMRSEALALIDELQHQADDVYLPPQCYVFIYAGLGDRERALEYQDKAYEDGASPFNYLSPIIRDLYARDPYHKKRLEQMRLKL